MPKIIVTSRIIKNSPKGNAGNLVKYMGTREGVEKLPINETNQPVTVRQQRLIRQIVKADPDAKTYPEYLPMKRSPQARSRSPQDCGNSACRPEGQKSMTSFSWPIL